MPIALTDKEGVPVWLAIDAEIPEENRPTFLCRYLTCKGVLEIEALLNRAQEADDQQETNRLLNEAIGISLLGWRNLSGANGKPMPFPRENLAGVLDEILTPDEKWELSTLATTKPRLAEIDLKKSALLRQSGQAQQGTPTGSAASAPASA